ncbi:MAG: hypothetical protein IKT70_02970 [Clostridia bacterium]|nr:hypothetical protein [Clostridia bacterium]
MATKKKNNNKKVRTPKTPLRVILVRILAIILAAMMVVTVAYYLFPVFSYAIPDAISAQSSLII